MKVLGERNIQTSESRKPVTLMVVILREAVILSEAWYAGWHEESPGNRVMRVNAGILETQVIVL